MQSEEEEANRYRILRQYYDVNERIKSAIENARDCILSCQEEILMIVDFMGEQSLPSLQKVRVRIAGYTAEEEEQLLEVQRKIQEKERADFSLRRAEIRSRYWQ
jgi:hypothetical protein